MPNDDGARGAAAIERLLSNSARDSEVIALISGGASALMTLPADGVSVADMVATSGALMRAGADIRELNCVRKHLDRLKGGMMAKLFAGARIRALVLSDVIGDPLDAIGSGPLVPDPTSFADRYRDPARETGLGRGSRHGARSSARRRARRISRDAEGRRSAS